MKYVDLMDIPIAHSPTKFQVSIIPTRWKRVPRKWSNNKGKTKSSQVYMINKRLIDYGRDSVAKKSKDIMEVDSEANATDLAEVGQSQPRQALWIFWAGTVKG